MIELVFILFIVFLAYVEPIDNFLALSHHNHHSSRFHRSAYLQEALHFLSSIQNPANCSATEYIKAGIGVKGGFAAQFQLAAREFMLGLAAGGFQLPVLIEGPLTGYSEGSQCKKANHQWTCFFEAPTKCQNQLSTQAKEQIIKNWPSEIDSIPPQFKARGLVSWWAAVQYYLFRFKPFVYRHIAEEAKDMHAHRGYPYGLPIAGMHVRHGDKKDDGFRTTTLEEELDILRKSPDCPLLNTARDCFVPLNLSDSHHISVVVNSASQGHTIILKAEDIERFNHSASNDEIAVDPKSFGLSNSKHHNKLAMSNSNHSSPIHRAMNTTTAIMGNYVIPLAIFVASDDSKVLSAAEQRGFLVDPVGISQQSASTSMILILLRNKELGYNASLEIISDIHFLSHCSTLLGMAASQVFRISVAISNITNTLKYVRVTDLDQVGRIQFLSKKYSVPFPEVFT